jgi:hypothetical protein
MSSKNTNNILKCIFKNKNSNDSEPFIIEICNETNTIKNSEMSGFQIWHSHIKELLETKLKNREGDIMDQWYNWQYSLYKFNKYENPYSQIQKHIFRALKDNKNAIVFICEIHREVLCNCCKKIWFTPIYNHINMCDDCSDCFFD